MHPGPRHARAPARGRPTLPALLAGGLAAAALLAPLAASAQAIAVRPIGIELVGDQHAAVLNVTNTGAAPTVVQARAFSWRQSKGEEQLSPTSDLALSPPFAQIAPGQSQVIRLVLRTPKVAQETAYRVVLDQVPTPGPNGVMLAVRISIPIFIEPDLQSRPRLDWRMAVGPGGQGELLASNTGPRHARLSQVRVTVPGKPPIVVENGAVKYVLPGAEQIWRLGAIGAADGLSQAHVTATTDQGPLDADATVAPKP